MNTFTETAFRRRRKSPEPGRALEQVSGGQDGLEQPSAGERARARARAVDGDQDHDRSSPALIATGLVEVLLQMGPAPSFKAPVDRPGPGSGAPQGSW